MFHISSLCVHSIFLTHVKAPPLLKWAAKGRCTEPVEVWGDLSLLHG